MNRFVLILLALIFIVANISSAQTVVTEGFETRNWNEHYAEKSAIGDMGPGTLVIASDISDVQVASLSYSTGKIADLYYPLENNFNEPKAAVILVSGDSDSHSKGYYERTLKDTDQYMEWGQVIAEEGMIAITYELDNPQLALETLVSWLVTNKVALGIDISRLGFFSTNENGCTIGMETVVPNSRNYSGPKPVFSIFYYGMLPLRSSKELYVDVPILTVQTKDLYYRGIPESMEKFNQRAMRDGARLTAIYYPDGAHWFDCKEDTPRTREILEETLWFMRNSVSNSANQ